MLSFTEKAWSPYVVGVMIVLLQIPAFLLIGSSYVTIGGLVASWLDPAALKIDHIA